MIPIEGPATAARDAPDFSLLLLNSHVACLTVIASEAKQSRKVTIEAVWIASSLRFSQ
jgi:hypothetical protein